MSAGAVSNLRRSPAVRPEGEWRIRRSPPSRIVSWAKRSRILPAGSSAAVCRSARGRVARDLLARRWRSRPNASSQTGGKRRNRDLHPGGLTDVLFSLLLARFGLFFVITRSAGTHA